MKVGITAKLFLFVLLACAAVVVVQGAAFRFVMERGFLGYLNQQSRMRMEEVVPRLEKAYAARSSWDFLRSDFREWVDLVLPFLREPGVDPASRVASSDQTGALARMGLLDADMRRVVGNPDVDPSSIRIPIVVEGRTVGWVAMVPFEAVLPKKDERFLEQQFKALTMVGLGSILVAALLTFVLARALLRRVRAMAQATHHLASGDYASRIAAGANDELGALARDFNRMAQTLEHTERARRGFMADISHELRTPLAVLRAQLEAIQDGIRSPTVQSTNAMHLQVQRLGKLVNDLHDLSLSDVGAMAYRRVSIDAVTVLQAAAGSMQGRLEAASLRLVLQIPQGPLTISGDEPRLHQLFGNLLENSLRYTDGGGVVRVHCARHGAHALIVIEDSAPGVPADKMEKLFERFYRVEGSRNRATGGSGLGLAICRNIVEAHEGRITASASRSGGLCIAIELPLASG
ncbi:sensor histidine kinase efflux regulator BaeS [Variovorax sp. LjRoot178]|uniref:sensor histidine kinase efflux regulator BaeS n=1 Tax=Variovorax sp. LjRoot178 TaxID=3342277 RepID=UPI003ECD1AD4